jgi:two-component system, cell cycle response regulator
VARILIIEDNTANLALMEYLLGAHGHDVLVATDGEQGLARAIEARPDVVLMDIELPGMNGFAAAAAIREKADPYPPPIVAVTASAMVGDRERILAAGFTGYIGKPIAPQTFTRGVESFVGSEVRQTARGGE